MSPIPFFMDNILTSTICQHYYHEGFGTLILPTILDAGHPPLFYIYLTVFWKIFGMSVWSSHLAMAPFMFLFLWSVSKMVPYVKGRNIVGLFPLFAGPILAQFTMPSYDFVMTAISITALVVIQRHKIPLFYFLLALLSLLSLRGVIISFSIALCYGYIFDKFNKKFALYGMLSLIPILVWLIYHYQMTGWCLASPSTHWQSQRNFGIIQYVIPNCIGLVRCFTDNGMMIVSIVFLFFTIKNKDYKFLILIILLTTLNVAPLMFTSNPILQRYLLLIYTLMMIRIVGYFIQAYLGKLMLLVLGIILLSSNVFYYTYHSNSWDTNALYFRYFRGFSVVENFLSRHNISKRDCAASFPVFNAHKQIYTNGDTLRMQDVLEIPLGTTPYIIYSNASNAFEYEKLKEVKRRYYKLEHIAFYPFYFDIYKIKSIN